MGKPVVSLTVLVRLCCISTQKLCHKTIKGGVYLLESVPKNKRQSSLFHFAEVSMKSIISKTTTLLSDLRLRFVGLLAVLTLLWACYPVSEVSYSNPQDSSANQWLIEIRTGEAKVQLTMRYSRQRDGGGFSFNSTGFGIPMEQLVGLTREQAMSSGSHVQFQLNRDAGTFNFEGWFKEGNGAGHFTFSPSASFATELNRQGFGKPTDAQLLRLAMQDVGFALINELKAQGYDLATVEQLVRMGDHGVRLDFVQGLKALGYSLKSVDFLVKMKDHGVSLNFIRELAGLGFTGLSPEELIRTKDHGVNAEYIGEFISAGYNRASLNDWITLKDHGVSTQFVVALKDLGYSRVELDDLRNMKDHGVSPTFIQELKAIGYNNTPIDQLIRLKDHGVDASYIRRLKERGYGDLSLDEFIRLKDIGTK
jgi:hypothetical protein